MNQPSAMDPVIQTKQAIYTSYSKVYNLKWKIGKLDSSMIYTSEQFLSDSVNGIEWKLSINFEQPEPVMLISYESHDKTVRKINYIANILFGGGLLYENISGFGFEISPTTKIRCTFKTKLHTESPMDVLARGEAVTLNCRIEMPLDTEMCLRISIFGNLYDDISSADVAVKVGDKIFRAHRIVLACWSPVLAEMILGDEDSDVRDEIEIIDFSAAAVEGMLKFMYKEMVPNLDQLAMELLAVGEAYNIPSLKDLCELNIANNLTAQNVGDVMVAARLLSAPNLYQKAREFKRGLLALGADNQRGR